MADALLKSGILVALLLAVAFPGDARAQAPGVDVPMSEMPVLVLYCEEDPGPVSPGGGRGLSPDRLREKFDCRPGAGVALTFSNQAIDWFLRCDMDQNGECMANTPVGPPPKYELDVAVHLATVDPGYAPKELVGTAANYTEFAGYGVVLLPTGATTPLPDGERQTLAVNVARCEDGSDAEECKRKPVEALVQASAGEMTAEGHPWLATNDEGWVSFDRVELEGKTIDLMLQTDRKPRFACTDAKSGERLATEWIEGREGNFIRLTPISDGNISCDVTLLGGPERQG